MNRVRRINFRRLLAQAVMLIVLLVAAEATLQVVGVIASFKETSISSSARFGFTFGLVFSWLLLPSINRGCSALRRRLDPQSSNAASVS